MGFLQLWEPIIFHANLWLQWGLKKSCSPCQDLFNGMLHTVYTRGNQGDSWLLVVGSQIDNLTPSPSFGHNLCFKCPNEQRELILDICVLIAFQWYKEPFKPMGFSPYNCILKIPKSIWDSNSHNGNSFGSVKVHSFTLFALPGTSDVTPGSSSWPATLQPLALVTSPRLRLRQYL
jgi:hypothetical protein